MNRKELDGFLRYLDMNNHWVFSTQMAGVYFNESDNTLRHSLARHVKNKAIVRLTKGLYANWYSRSRPSGFVLESLVKHLRPHHFSYVSLESRLSEEGVISQVPTRLTVMTTGKSKLFNTPFGGIEFTHTTRKTELLYPRTRFDPDRSAWIASPALAYEDLKFLRRNLALVDYDELKEAQSYWEGKGESTSSS